MGAKGGLSLRFEPLDEQGIQTLLHIQYIKPNDALLKGQELQLLSDVYLSPKGTQVLANGECLKKDKIYTPGDKCTVQLLADSAWSTLPIVMFLKTKPTDGSPSNTVTARTYLAPRALLTGESRPWPSGGPAFTKETFAGEYANISPQECFDSDNGYVFLEDSISVESRPSAGATLASCGSIIDGKKFALDKSGKRICVKQFNGAPTTGDHKCFLGITATEATVKWVPPPPPAGQ